MLRRGDASSPFGSMADSYWWLRGLMRRLLFQAIPDTCLMLEREATGCEGYDPYRRGTLYATQRRTSMIPQKGLY